MDRAREQTEAAVKANLALFADGSHLYGEGPLDQDEAGTRSWIHTNTNSVATETIDPPQKAAAAGGIVWFQRTTQTFEGSQQVYNRCHYAARLGDFVATLDVNVPDSREKANEWFQKQINACKQLE